MTPFHLLAGGMFVVVAMMAAWGMRGSDRVPLGAKVLVFSALVFLACLVPFLQYQSRDMPLETTWNELPRCVDIVAFQSAEPNVDMWLNGLARIVRIPLVNADTELFVGVREALQHGEPFVRVCKDASGGNNDGDGNDGVDAGGNSSAMKIDKSLFLSNLKQ